MVELLESLCTNNELVAAAVYLSTGNLNSNDAEVKRSEYHKKIFEFKYSSENIVLVDSYFDNGDSKSAWNRLVEDASTGRYQVILTCGELTGYEGVCVPILDVLKYLSSD